jgi:hypothetical protein
MANVIKYTTTQPTLQSARKGNVALGTGVENYGPSSTTGYYSGVDVPEGGFVVYTLGANNSPKAFVASSDEDLPAIARTLGGGELDYLAAKNYLVSLSNTWILDSIPKSKVTDGLRLDLNAGNLSSFVDNLPATNVLNNNIIGTGNGAYLGTDEFGDYIQLPDISSGYSRLQLPNIPVSSDETYTWSFELYTTETFTQSGNYLFDTNEYSDQYPASNDLSRLSSSHLRPNTIPANTWTKFSLTVTMKSGLTGAYTYDFFNFYFPAFQNKKVYYRNMQFERSGTATPYMGQGATRLQNTTWYDVSGYGNNFTPMNNMTFTGHSFDFNGIDSGVQDTISSYNPDGADSVLECLFKPMDLSQEQAIFSDNFGPEYGFWIHTNGKLRAVAYASVYADLEIGKWYHAIMNIDPGVNKNSTDQTYVQLYLNGVYIGQSNANTGNGMNDQPFTLGYDYKGGSPSTYFSGSIAAASVYYGQFTQDEVSQNYYQAPIVTDGLVLAVDAGNLVSYESGSSTTYDMALGNEGDGYGTSDSNGTLTNGVLYSGNNGGTWSFDGVDDYISFGTQAFQYQYDDAFSLEVWCNPDAVSGFKHLIGVTYASYRLAHSNNSISFRLDANNIMTGGGTLVVGKWSHIIATWNPSTFTAKVYQNGVQVSSVINATVDWVSQGTDFRIASSPGENYYFNGKIPIGRVYNKTLSANEVLQNYNAQKSRFGL